MPNPQMLIGLVGWLQSGVPGSPALAVGLAVLSTARYLHRAAMVSHSIESTHRTIIWHLVVYAICRLFGATYLRELELLGDSF